MKKGVLFIALVALIQIGCKSSGEYEKNKDGGITWINIETAASLTNADNKKYFVDLYTDWCGWCKVMDKKTFTDQKVIDFLDQNFHNVKFNAEQTTPVEWDGQKYEYRKGGRRGVNMLAPYLLNNRLSYPSFAILDENRKPISVIVGYKKPDQLLDALNKI